MYIISHIFLGEVYVNIIIMQVQILGVMLYSMHDLGFFTLLYIQKDSSNRLYVQQADFIELCQNCNLHAYTFILSGHPP